MTSEIFGSLGSRQFCTVERTVGWCPQQAEESIEQARTVRSSHIVYINDGMNIYIYIYILGCIYIYIYTFFLAYIGLNMYWNMLFWHMFSLFIMIIRIYLQHCAGYIIEYCNVVCILQHVYVYHVHILRMWSLGIYIYICTGWWFQPLWKMMEFVSWDFYSQYMESHKTHVPNHQNLYMYSSLVLHIPFFFEPRKVIVCFGRLTLGRTRNWVRFCKLLQSHAAINRSSISGWWLTYPSEKWWSSSVVMMNFPNILGQS